MMSPMVYNSVFPQGKDSLRGEEGKERPSFFVNLEEEMCKLFFMRKELHGKVMGFKIALKILELNPEECCF